MSEHNVYYILLVTKTGKKKEKSILRSQFQEVEVLPGSLLIFLAEKDISGRILWTLELLEPENTEVECSPEEIQQIKSEELALLQAIPICYERIVVFQDKEWLQEGLTLSVGDYVLVSLKGNPDLSGVLRHKGELKDQNGVQFGVELSKEHRGKGTCEGVFRKQRYFSCEQNSGVFVPLHKIRKDPTKQRIKADIFKETIGASCNLPKVDLDIGMRVVWMSDSGPEHGVVKWIGILPDSRKRDEPTVGVEFDNPVGSGTGKYKNHRLFVAKAQHASLVPLLGLIREDEFLSPKNPPWKETEDYNTKGMIEASEKILREQEELLYDANKRKQLSRSGDPKYDILINNKNVEADKTHPNYQQKQQAVAEIHPMPYKVGTAYPIKREVVKPVGEEIIKPPKYMYDYENVPYDHRKRGVTAVVPSAPLEKDLMSKDSNDQSLGRRSSNKSIPNVDPDLEVGSVVEVMNNPPLYGLIRWIGYLPDQKEPRKRIAGLEMEDEISAGTDGLFGQHRLFTCLPKKAFFVPLYKCRKDKRFVEKGGAGLDISGDNFGHLETPDIVGNISPPDSLELYEIQKKVCGKERGIQGHHNSCYLDATLFAMFYFTTVFDGILYREKGPNDIKEYDEVKIALKEGIVNPLRKRHYVRADKVMKLRRLMDKLGNIPGMMNEEKDPEEFLTLLLSQITKADPLLHIRSEMGQEVQHTFLYQLIMEKDERLVLPTTQQLFELSFLQLGVKLQERPSCLILQMPRFGKDYKMYRRIIPSLELDISDVLDYAPRECIICGDLAAFECKECYNTHGAGLNTIAFCEGCKKTSHQHKLRKDHKPKPITVPYDYILKHNQQKKALSANPTIPREKMELFAVVCIQTSHYVSFVKCGQGRDAPWVFFDSMADRMGEQSGYNIPEVKLCGELTNWLSEDHQDEIMKRSDDKDLPEHMRRLLCDAYMCMYQSVNVSMFK